MSMETVVRFEKLLPSGWELCMLVVRLPERGALVYSPTWLGEDTFARVDAIGEPRVLVAPNHFHHLSLARFHERYPSAKVVCGTTALPRLRAKGYDYVAPVSEAADLLPSGAAFLECEGTRAGETFLSLPSTNGDSGRTWLACDAFFNVERPVTGITGVGLRALKTTPGLSIGQTFRWLALKEERAYAAWLVAAIAREKPTRLYLSHGEPIASPELPARLAALAKSRLAEPKGGY